FSAAIRGVVLGAPKNLVTAALVFAGIMSNAASEVGYVVIVPLGAAIFYSLGRHPLAGLAAAFAGVSAGYSANFLIGTIDPLLAGITQEAARMIDPPYEVHPAVNWYFMAASVPVVTFLGTWITAAVVEPRLGKFDPSSTDETLQESDSLKPLRRNEKRGLLWAAVACGVLTLLLIYGAGPFFSRSVDLWTPDSESAADWREVCRWDSEELSGAMAETERRREKWIERAEQAARQGEPEGLKRPAVPSPRFETRTYAAPIKEGARGTLNNLLLSLPGYGVLRNPRTGDPLRAPLLRGVVAIIFVFFLVPGYVYGSIIGTMRTDKDVIDAMSKTMGSMGLYIVLTFFAAQFVNFFEWTNLGAMLAVLGAQGIRSLGLDNPLVFVPFILLCCFTNLMMGSASAKWAVTAPIFVPMMMLIGYSPEVIQCAYRIGDSTTNVITPMMSYFGMIFAFATRYQRSLGIGTMISLMLPYTIVFLVGWVLFFYLWVFVFGMPIGPGASLKLEVSAASASMWFPA
ncbi:MAG: AbgT family transporter, partial [Planctomycetota bacterium]